MTDEDRSEEQATGPRKDFSATLRVGSTTIDRRDIEMLDAIDRTGSLHEAAAELGRSYAHLQRRVVELETALGELTVRRRGGSGGGGTDLTENAHEMRHRFARHNVELEGVAAVEESVFRGPVQARRGELARVSTAPGPLLAIVPPGASTVDVTVRADTVVLANPGGPPGPEGTSLRNRLTGRIEAIESGDATAWVTLGLAGDERLAALITTESLERLDLQTGREVVASFKATAARGTAVETADGDHPD